MASRSRVLVLLVAVPLAACGGGQASAGGQDGKPRSRVEIVTDWSDIADRHSGDADGGFKEVRVNGRACVVWSRGNGSYGSDSGISCDWSPR